MNKQISKLVLCICLVTLLVGCSNTDTNATSYISYTYSVDTGDAVEIKLDTSGGYILSSELPFTISCGEDVLSQGTFIASDDYVQYVNAVNNDDKAVILDSGNKNGNEYIFWKYNDSEYNYAIQIADSNTGIIIGNVISEESAKECFDRLKISVE